MASVWKRLFPNSGTSANKMKRWMRFQQTMNKKRWFELDRERNGPITLYDFSNYVDAMDAALVDETSRKGGWRISDDSIIDGYSRATFELIRTKEDYQRILRGEPPVSFFSEKGEAIPIAPEATPEGEEEGDEDKFIPFVRWKGTIDTRVNETSDAQRSGFCAIRSPEFPFGGADLGGRYNGIEIMCRSDGRPYSVNLKIETFIAEDLFQTFINIPPTPKSPLGNSDLTGGPFDRVVLLFQHFIVTAGGRMRANQRDLDNSVKIESIGITLMDGVDGDFQFDLAKIRAVNYDESGVIGEAD